MEKEGEGKIFGMIIRGNRNFISNCVGSGRDGGVMIEGVDNKIHNVRGYTEPHIFDRATWRRK